MSCGDDCVHRATVVLVMYVVVYTGACKHCICAYSLHMYAHDGVGLANAYSRVL